MDFTTEKRIVYRFETPLCVGIIYGLRLMLPYVADRGDKGNITAIADCVVTM